MKDERKSLLGEVIFCPLRVGPFPLKSFPFQPFVLFARTLLPFVAGGKGPGRILRQGLPAKPRGAAQKKRRGRLDLRPKGGIMSNRSTVTKRSDMKHSMTPSKTTARAPFAERIGRTLGRAWRGASRLEENASQWLMAQGLPRIVAKALPLLLKLAVLGGALYVAFWVTVVLVLAIVAAESARSNAWRKQPEWRDGPEGIGLYTRDGVCIDYCDND
jgi:hypothetical protein